MFTSSTGDNQMERAIVGTSEAVEAEYAAQCAASFCLALAVDNEIYSVEGFKSLAAAIKSAKEGGFSSAQIEVLG